MESKRVLTISGSPRGRRATSQILAGRIGVRMLNAGWHAESIAAASSMRLADGPAQLLQAFDAADSVAIVTPLYVDSLPAPLTAALQMLTAAAVPTDPPKSLGAVLNCGFPEARHNEFAIAICRHFAEAAGCRWLGAVSIGGGGMVGGKPLDTAGRFGGEIIAALDVLVEALRTGEPIPVGAGPTVVEPPMSPAAYAVAGDAMWRMQAIKYGTLLKLGARPYERPDA